MSIDLKKFKKVFDVFYNPLCNFCYKITRNHQDAEDIVQDVFLNVWNHREEIDAEANLKQYLFKSVRNRAIESQKSKERKEHKKAQIREEQRDYVSVEDNADKYMLIEYVFNSIRQLPPKCQRIFIMSKVEGLTYKEIASNLGISEKTVENQIRRAYQLLRKKLGVE